MSGAPEVSRKHAQIDQKILQFETFINDVVKEDLRKLEAKLGAKNTDILEFLQLKNTIKTLQNTNADRNGFKTQLDMGNNFYVQAHVEDASKILLDVGLGHFVEFTLDEALAVINVRIKLFELQVSNLRREIAKAKAHIKLILMGISDLQETKKSH